MSGKRQAGILVLPVLLALTTGMAGPLLERAGAAESFSGTYNAKAAADGIRITVLVPHAPLSNTVMDGGGPSAHAILDTAGRSESFASFPYPGENVVTAPPLIAGASGGKINLPNYPFWVGSSHPSIPKQESGSGPYTIKAESSDTSSTAVASAGLDAGGQGAVGLARSTASTVSAVEAVTAEAATEVTSFALGPLRIGRVFSTAKTMLGSDGQLTREADTQIVGAMVGDTPVAITPKGVVIAGQTAPVEGSAVRELLTQAKINVELMPREDAASGVTSPAVRVTQQDQYGQSGTTATYLIGAAAAFVDGFTFGNYYYSSEAPASEVSSGPASDQGSESSPPTQTQPVSPTPQGTPQDVIATSGVEGIARSDVSSLVPSPQKEAATVDGAAAPAFVPEPVAPPTVSLSTDTAVPAPGTPTRAQLAARLLVSPSDTTPMFVVMAVAMAVTVTLLSLVRRKPRVR